MFAERLDGYLICAEAYMCAVCSAQIRNSFCLGYLCMCALSLLGLYRLVMATGMRWTTRSAKRALWSQPRGASQKPQPTKLKAKLHKDELHWQHRHRPLDRLGLDCNNEHVHQETSHVSGDNSAKKLNRVRL